MATKRSTGKARSKPPRKKAAGGNPRVAKADGPAARLARAAGPQRFLISQLNIQWMPKRSVSMPNFDPQKLS